MTTRDETIELMKAQQWEIVKGHLRAMIALEGSRMNIDTVRSGEKLPFQLLQDRIDAFIEGVEGDGYHE